MNTMKYRVLAADDEYWGRENIRALIPWAEYSMEFLEPAQDGEEVLERIPQERPHIVLTDINMPFMDGLELLRHLKEDYPEIITVAISGYDDFEKVKGVFTSGGIDYLLKPVGKEELVNVLKKSLEILEDREAQRAGEENSRLQERKMSSFLEDREYSALLSEKLYHSARSQLHIPSTAAFSEVVTVLVKFYDISEIAARYDHDIFQMSWVIKSRLRELFGGEGKTVIFNNSSKMSEFVIVGAADTAALKRFADKVCREFPSQEYGPVSVVLHGQASSLDDIGTVYRELIAALVTRPFRRSHWIMDCQETGGCDGASMRSNVPHRFEEELYHLLVTGQTDRALSLTLRTGEFERCGREGWSFLEVKQYVGRIGSILTRFVQESRPEMAAYTEEIMEGIDYQMKCLDAEAMLTALRGLFENLGEVEERKNADTAAWQAAQIHDYIEKSYFESITLSSLAQEYHMDASYLSRVFSQKYGETVIAFLTRVRMEHAAELMRDGDKNLETISFLVGYDDYNYFGRVFRKKMGTSPSEYRSQLLSKI